METHSSSESSCRYHKVVKHRGTIEYWGYSTIKHPYILDYEYKEGKYKDELILPLGRPAETSLDSVICMVDFLLFCEENGIVYGDVKLENMIIFEDDIYIIDFGIIYFPKLPYTIRSQTYIDMHTRPLRKYDLPEHAGKNLVWAFGFFVLRCLGVQLRKEIYTSDVVNKLYFELDDDLDTTIQTQNLGEWGPLVRNALGKDRPISISDLLHLIPIEIPRSIGKIDYHPTPELPHTWDTVYDNQMPSLVYMAEICIENQIISSIIIAIELYWRYRHVFLKELNGKEYIYFFFACLRVALVLYGGVIGEGSVAFNCNLSIEKVKESFEKFEKFLGNRFPSLFATGLSTPIHDPKLSLFHRTVGNPINILRINDEIKIKDINGPVKNIVHPKIIENYIEEFVIDDYFGANL
jgi:hypothetical protein